MEIPATNSKRKLAAILSADAAGYSRMMGEDEQGTVQTLNACRDVFRAEIARFQGRIVDTAGDNVLAEFSSVVEAVRCAMEIQSGLAQRNADSSESRRMHFRIGINLGDVIEQSDGSIYGDGVNVAARVQALAPPGAVTISGTVHDHIETKLPLTYVSLGQHVVKNIAKPVSVFQVASPSGSPLHSPISVPKKRSRRALISTLVAALVILVSAGTWYQSSKRSAADPMLAMPEGPAIAVLPFDNLSGDPKQDYFSDGLTEQIIAEFSRFRNIRVIARNSSFLYKGKAVDVRKLGLDLKARYVLEGSVRQDQQRVRVTAQLLDARDGSHLWAETYERPFTAGAIFGVQDEITSHVVGAIAGAYGAIARATWEQSKNKGTQSMDAYHCVLVTREYWRTNAEGDHLKARSCLEDAVKIDPNYAEAWAMLAMVYGEEHMFGYNVRPNSIDRANEAAQRAIAVDPTHQRAQEALAYVYFYRKNAGAFYPQAERAIALNPNNEDTLANLGLFMTYIGMVDAKARERGLALVRKAMALNPAHPGFYHFPTAWAYWWTGDQTRALEEANKINQPDLFWTYVTLAMIQGAQNKRAEAAPNIAKLIQLNPGFAKEARTEWHKWNIPDTFIDQAIADLRRAGLMVEDK